MRALLFCVGAILAAAVLAPAPASANGQIVTYRQAAFAPGTIVVRTGERRLYLVLPGGKALRYPIAVGRKGMQWQGRARIVAKFIKPAWAPPPPVKGAAPRPSSVIPGGAPSNPMGAAAMVLTGNDYGIHGTNEPGSIGRFVPHGCIRMYNADVLSLFKRVRVGTLVVVLR